MNMKKTIAILTALMLTVTPSDAMAQKKKRTVAKPKATVVDKEMEERLEVMRASTQKIMFIDSVVVDKKKMLEAIKFPEEAGSIHRYSKFFNTQEQANGIVFLNQLRNRCFYSHFENGEWALYSKDLVDGKWTRGERLKGLELNGNDIEYNYPFVMADGTTMYFSAKSEDGIGGYDIYVTRLDESTGRYLKPENVGMPFNSMANDYFIIADEYDGIGWFATDRRQPDGKVCIYTFLLNNIRVNYNAEEYSPEQLRGLSEISSISDTWTDVATKNKGLSTMKAIVMRMTNKTKKSDFEFIIDDNHTYTTLSDFKSKEAARKFNTLFNLKNKKIKLDNSMVKARDVYPKSNATAKAQYKTQLIAAEKQSEKYEIEIDKLTKEIRRIELEVLNK